MTANADTKNPTVNPFAITHTAATDSPFAGGGSQDDEDAGIPLPPTPIGVLPGHITEVRKTDKGAYWVDIKCDAPDYAGSDKVSMYLAGSDVSLLTTIAASVGVTVELRGGRAFFVDSDGNKGLSALKNKCGHFVFSTWNGSGQVNKYGLPKKGSSPEWDQYVEEADLSNEHIAAIKKARGGVIPGDLVHLFQ